MIDHTARKAGLTTETLFQAVLDCLMNHGMQHTEDTGSGEKYPLVDKLCAPGDDSIKTGKEEVEILAEDIVDAIGPMVLAAHSADARNGDTVTLDDDGPVTDAMVYAFHRATTDGPLGEADFNEIRDALRAALLAATAAPAPGQLVVDGLTDEMVGRVLRSYIADICDEKIEGICHDLCLEAAIRAAPAAPAPTTRDEIEARQRAAMKTRFAGRPTSPATADFDLPAPNDAAAAPAAQADERTSVQYLCKAWGETDLPAVAIVTGLDGVRAFLVAEWLGSADDTQDDGTNSLDDALQDMQEQWQLEGEAWEWSIRFEIGGISVQKVFSAARQQSAAPAAPIFKRSLTLTGAQLLEALDFIAPDKDADQLESEVTIQYGDGHSGAGHYCWVADYPEEGAILLDGTSITPADAAQADVLAFPDRLGIAAASGKAMRQQSATPGVPVADGIAWQSTGTGVERNAVMVDGRSWYRDDHPSVRATPADAASEADKRDAVTCIGEFVCGEVEWLVGGPECGDYEIIYTSKILDEINENHQGKSFAIYIDSAAIQGERQQGANRG